ncbi:MAG: hypothetical protein IJE49_10295 [Agathobacter sp.]|nr:hypothetical protein [Agathobacter sp.]
MSKKSTNYELLRILLTIFIPTYHWLLYNGIFYADNSINNLISIIPFTGISFSCLYAFITMSSFFLLKKKSNWSMKKVLDFVALLLTLLLFKNIVINGLYPGKMMNYYVDTFFLKGAWWYVYPYVLLMIFYPLLNHFIYHCKKTTLYICTALLGLWFLINEYMNLTIMLNDCVMFLFLYFLMACLMQHEPSSFYKKHKKIILFSIYTICVVAITVISLLLKLPNNGLSLEFENEIFQWAHGRYNILGVISGIALFTIFKDIEVPYIPIIHKASKITLFVFLLHETVMCVFWYFEIKSCEFLAYLPSSEFFGLFFIYIVFCIFGAFLIYQAYYTLFAPLWERAIHWLCEVPIIKKLETTYIKLMEK